MKTRSFAPVVLAAGGLILIGLGIYFVLFRPPLLPEDIRFIGASLDEVRTTFPGLLVWLHRVFWVLGGFIFATGLLTLYIAITALQQKPAGIGWPVFVAGASSIGWMVMVNFLIQSDFRWLLLSFTLPWFAAMGLLWKDGRSR